MRIIGYRKLRRTVQARLWGPRQAFGAYETNGKGVEQLKFSIVVPAYNEEGAVQETLRPLRERRRANPKSRPRREFRRDPISQRRLFRPEQGSWRDPFPE